MTTTVDTRVTVLRAIAFSVVGDDPAAIDDAEHALAYLLDVGALHLRLEMAIDSSTTALSPLVIMSFRDGTHILKTFAELDIPDYVDVD